VIAGRPQGGDRLEVDLDELKDSGITTVVSLLNRAEVFELGLGREPEFCRSNGIEFGHFPIPDRAIPVSPDAVLPFADALTRDIRDGRSIAIHCRAGIGRSSLLAACVLVRLGIEAEDALARIKEARGVPVPDTDEQRNWILAFANRNDSSLPP
jgi:protein-tyrosine phosphatase